MPESRFDLANFGHGILWLLPQGVVRASLQKCRCISSAV
ncbi:MAG: hypothetical protein ACI97A_003284 [Planctomycetota bacterium]|jgi:hypothetical protein